MYILYESKRCFLNRFVARATGLQHDLAWFNSVFSGKIVPAQLQLHSLSWPSKAGEL